MTACQLHACLIQFQRKYFPNMLARIYNLNQIMTRKYMDVVSSSILILPLLIQSPSWSPSSACILVHAQIIVIFFGHFCPRGKVAWGYPYVKHQPRRNNTRDSHNIGKLHALHDTKLIVLLCSHVVQSSPLQFVLPHSNQFPFLPKANSESKRGD